ncbi:MAG TPA: sigma-54 dependent transcriptional regulator [Smithellaceae bacterium]|nr:sigma-54 dependent transcriptional regulator [Smithellaceae bacterium]
MAKILIVDDDKLFCELLTSALTDGGHQVDYAYSLKSGMQCVSQGSYDVVLLDVVLPDGNGLEKLSEIHHTASAPEVIIVTGAGTANGAELAIKSGAWDYIQKPSSISTMILPLIRALQYREEKLKKKPILNLKMGGLIGNSLSMKACYELLAEAASCDANVLITGETGTGKELFAKAIHENSIRSGGSFVIVDCAALTQNLTESTLFGYEKGAFTGADQRREGLILQAHGGTLFLDEIGELPLVIQKGFLRVLQDHRFRPLGAVRQLASDFRLIAATNRNLEQLVEQGLFRQDLLFRIRSISLEVPPLRNHLSDLIDIAAYHTARICKRSHMEPKKFSPDFEEALLSYEWPGNVRELVNAIERAIAAASSLPTLFPMHLPSAIRVKLAKSKGFKELSDETPSGDVMPEKLSRLKDFRNDTYARAEKQYLQQLMSTSKGDIETACKISGVCRARLYEIMKKHQIKIT